MSEFMFAGGDNFSVFGDLCLALLSAICGGHYAHTTSLKQTVQYRYLYRIQYTDRMLDHMRKNMKTRSGYFPKYRFVRVPNQIILKIAVSLNKNG